MFEREVILFFSLSVGVNLLMLLTVLFFYFDLV